LELLELLELLEVLGLLELVEEGVNSLGDGPGDVRRLSVMGPGDIEQDKLKCAEGVVGT
jgi:hypothetical protein